MLNLFKKTKIENLVSPINGLLIPIDQVKDDVFSSKMMGNGFAVEPNDNNFASPVSGKVLSVFPTKHAISIESKNGLEILLHLGLDTVEMNGDPFDIKIKEKDNVNEGQVIGTIDTDMIVESGRSDTVVVIITNMDAIDEFPIVETKQILLGDKVSELGLK